MLTAILAAVGAALYRLRGGLWKMTTTPPGARWWNGTHACRAIWALPTGLLAYFLVGGPWWLAVALVVTVFLSVALFGHGAHMIYGPAYWTTKAWEQQTEFLTKPWIESVFDGYPARDWPEAKTDLFNMIGMSAIGLVRNALAISPLVVTAPGLSAIYTLTGLLHGPLYWLGWRISPDIKAAECLIGAASWSTITVVATTKW